MRLNPLGSKTAAKMVPQPPVKMLRMKQISGIDPESFGTSVIPMLCFFVGEKETEMIGYLTLQQPMKVNSIFRI
jgi:hypothetical protein